MHVVLLLPGLHGLSQLHESEGDGVADYQLVQMMLYPANSPSIFVGSVCPVPCSSLMMMSRTILCGKGKSLARQVWIWFSGKERTWLRSTIEARQSKFKVSLEGINIYYLIFISFESINEIDESWEFEALCQFLDINEIRKMGRVPFKHQIQPVCDLPKERDFVINWIVSIER